MMDLDPWKMPLSGTSLIEASAGTGKTYTLTTLYLRLLVEFDLSPSEILVVTFTQAATAELRERVRERIEEALETLDTNTVAIEDAPLRALAVRARDESAKHGRPDPLRRALQAFDEASISTIHGFCQRTLQENAFESGLAFDAELLESHELPLRTLAHDLWARLLEEVPPSRVGWLLDGGGKRWQFEPERLYQDVLRAVSADEEMPVLAGMPGDLGEKVREKKAARLADSAAFESKLADQLRAWAAQWRAEGAQAGERLLQDEGLSRSKYKVDTLTETWLPALDRFAARIESTEDEAALITLPLPIFFSKLSSTKLAAGAKQNFDPIVMDIFDRFEAVADSVAEFGEMLDGMALDLRRRFVEEVRLAAKRRREEQHQLFFDDLLSELRRALRGEQGEGLVRLLRARYRFALIDEFQDTDPVQYEIFRRVWHEGGDGSSARERGLVLIGDPKQAIYAFRGADVFTYLSAREDAGDRRFSLPINYRSDAALIEAVNALFAQQPNPFQIEGIEFRPVRARPNQDARFLRGGAAQPGLRVLLADREEAAALRGDGAASDSALKVRFGRTTFMQAIARDIADLLDSKATIKGRPVRPSDIAVLARRKVELQSMRRALEAVGVPCVDRGDGDVFETREAWEFVSVLRAMIRPGDPATLRGALSTGAHGLSAAELLALADETPELAAISERYAEYGQAWKLSGFNRAFEQWRQREGVVPRLLAYQDGERRLTNWLHLAELLQRVAAERVPSRSSLVGWLEGAVESREVRESVGSDASLLRLETDDQAVSLVTIHRSKGLEYPIVYLPSLWEDPSARGLPSSTSLKEKKSRPPVRFHDAESERRTLDLAGDDAGYEEHIESAKEEHFSEQLRLLYVAMTRARHQTIVGWGAIASFAKTPLAWLLAGRHVEDVPEKKRKAAWKAITDEDWRRFWEALPESIDSTLKTDGTAIVQVENACFEPRVRWETPETKNRALDYTAPERQFKRSTRTTSFSALVREGLRLAQSGPWLTGRDTDADAAELARGAGREGLAEDVPDLAAAMHEFPKGAGPGTLLHEVLENVDFGDYSEDEVRVLATDLLTRNAVDVAHADQVLHVVDAVAKTNLRSDASPLRLGDLAPAARKPEIEFTMGTHPAEGASGFSPSRLAEILRQAAPESPLHQYAERAGHLAFQTLHGFLRGFIDLVFFDGERYFLADYKSNFLGARQADYQPEALVEPMIEHDYVLQYLVYSVALDRHLSMRIEDYDYDQHFGGAYYLFLRGLSEEHSPGCGVYFDRPEKEIVHALSQAMGDALEGAP